MPTTQYVGVGTYNPYRSGVTGGTIPGDANTGHLKRDISAFVEAMEPTETPIYSTALSKGRKRTVEQVKVESGIKHRRIFKTALSANHNNSTTTLTVGTTDIKLLQKHMVLRIVDATNGDEIVWCTADPDLGAGTIAILRAQGGTSAAAHDSGCVVQMVGTANPLNGPDFVTSPVVYGEFINNYVQRFTAGIKLDRLARRTPDLERTGDKLVQFIQEETQNQKDLVERALIYGKPQEGSLSSATPPLMGGIGHFLTTNTTNLAGAPLSAFDIEEITSSIWSAYGENVPKTLIMNLKTKRILNRLLNPYREITGSDTSLDLRFQKVTLETGTFEFMVSRYLPDGEIWGINWDNFEWCTYRDGNWSVEDVPETGFYNQKAISGTFSLLFRSEQASFRIYGFNTDLNAYPSVNL